MQQKTKPLSHIDVKYLQWAIHCAGKQLVKNCGPTDLFNLDRAKLAVKRVEKILEGMR